MSYSCLKRLSSSSDSSFIMEKSESSSSDISRGSTNVAVMKIMMCVTDLYKPTDESVKEKLKRGYHTDRITS